jgi:hypothetical protein
MKIAQETSTPFGGIPRGKKTMEAFPDYSKSMISQRHRDPVASGLSTGFGSGVVGAALGIALARILGMKEKGMAVGGGVGALAGGIPGFISGKNEAESENSRMLFLRRRLGINDPGEYDALMRQSERPVATIQKSKYQKVKELLDKEQVAELAEAGEKKAAMSPELKKNLITYLSAAGMGIGGYGVGSEITPRLGGYNDDTQAKRISGMMLAMPLAGIPFVRRTNMAPDVKSKVIAGLLGTAVGGEIVPTAVKTMNTTARSTKELADATKDVADRSMGGKITDLLQSRTGKGMAVGAGIAGVGAIGTGLLRPKTDREIAEGRTRSGMVTRDFLKYLIPALAAGGAVGNLTGE